MITEAQAQRAMGLADRLQGDDRREALRIAAQYEVQEEEAGRPTWPTLKRSVAAETNRLRGYFVDADTNGLKGGELESFQATFKGASDPTATRLRSVNMAYLAHLHGKDLDTSSIWYPQMKRQIAKERRGADDLGDVELFHLFKEDFDREDSLYSRAQESAMKGLDPVSSWAGWAKENGGRKPSQDEWKAWRDMHAQTGARLDPYRETIRATVADLLAKTGREGDTEASYADLAKRLLEVPEADQGIVLAAIGKAGSAPEGFKEGKNIVGDTGFLFQKLGENYARGARDLGFGAVAMMDRPGRLRVKGQVLNGRPVPNGANMTGAEYLRAVDLATAASMTPGGVFALEGGPMQAPTEEAQKEAVRLIKEASRAADLHFKIRQIADGVDPAEGEWLVTKGVFGAARSVPYMQMAMIPGGAVANAFALADDSYHRLREYNPEMSEETATAISLVGAPFQALIENFQAGHLLGRAPMLNAFLNKITVSKTSVGANYLLKAFGLTGLETGQEIVQDLTPHALQGLTAALSEDVPEVPWDAVMGDTVKNFPELVASIVPLALIGAGVGTYRDFKNSDALFSSSLALEAAVGISEARANQIVSTYARGDRAGAQAMLQEDFEGTDFAGRDLGEARTKLAETWREEAKRRTAAEGPLRDAGILPAMLRTAEGRSLVFSDGSRADFATYAEADEAMWTAARDHFLMVDEETRARIRHDQRAMNEGRGLAYEFHYNFNFADEAIESGEVSADAVAQREEIGERLQTPKQRNRVEPETKQGSVEEDTVFDASQAAMSLAADPEGIGPEIRQIILGSNKTEFKHGVYLSTIKLFRHYSPFTLIEEKLEGDASVLISNKRRNWMIQALREAEQITGVRLFGTHNDHAIEDRDLIEAWSHLGVSYFVGRSRKGDLGEIEGKRGEFRKILAEDIMRSRLGSVYRGYGDFFRAIFERAAKVSKARREGKLGADLEAELMRQLGLSEDLEQERQTEAAAVDLAATVAETATEEAWIDEGEFEGRDLAPVTDDAPFSMVKADFGEFREGLSLPDALAWLTEKKSGVAVGVLTHKDVDPISLVWGSEGDTKGEGFGLAKILKWHPEINPEDFQNLLDGMEVEKRTENTIVLAGGGVAAVLRRNIFGDAHTWLLTAYENVTPVQERVDGLDSASSARQTLPKKGDRAELHDPGGESSFSMVPVPGKNGAYGEYDWTVEQYPPNQRHKMNPMKRGFLGWVQGSKIVGKWFADVGVVDHSELGDKIGHDRFRYYPHARGGLVAWNFPDQVEDSSYVEVEAWLDENGWPAKKPRGDWGDIPQGANFSMVGIPQFSRDFLDAWEGGALKGEGLLEAAPWAVSNEQEFRTRFYRFVVDRYNRDGRLGVPEVDEQLAAVLAGAKAKAKLVSNERKKTLGINFVGERKLTAEEMARFFAWLDFAEREAQKDARRLKEAREGLAALRTGLKTFGERLKSGRPILPYDPREVARMTRGFDPKGRGGVNFSMIRAAVDWEGRIDAMFSPFHRSPVLRVAIGQEMQRRSEKVRRDMARLAATAKTGAEIEAERREVEGRLLQEKLDALGSNWWAAMAAEPASPLNDPLISELVVKRNGRWRGVLESRTAYERRTGNPAPGEYDGARDLNLPPFMWGGTEEPDQAASRLGYSDMDDFWNAIATAFGSARRLKEWQDAAKAQESEAKAAARAESEAWAAEQTAAANEARGDRKALLAALRTLDAIRAGLPVEVRGRVGGHVALAQLTTPAGMIAEIERRMEQIDYHLERWLRDEAQDRLEKLWKKAQPAKDESGKKRIGKAGADVHDLFFMLRDAVIWSATEAEAQVTARETSIASGNLTAEQEAHAALEIGLIELFGDWRNADAARRWSAIEEGERVWTGGYLAWQTKKQLQREERKARREELRLDSGKAGTAPERNRKARESLGFGESWKETVLDLLNFSQALKWAFGDKSKVAQWLADKERAAAFRKEDETMARLDRLDDFYRDLAGGSRYRGELVRWEMAQPSITVEVETPSTGTRDTMTLSESEAITALLMYRQEDGRRHMEGHKDENGHPVGAWHYGPGFIADLESRLTARARATMEFLIAEYSGEYESLNAIYRELHGINLPKNDKYSPLTVKPVLSSGQEMVDPVTRASFSGMTATPGSLRTRSRAAVAEPDFRDAVQTYVAHVKQIEHWKAYAELTNEARALLGHRDIGNSVEAVGGNQAIATLRGWIDFFQAGGARDTAAAMALNKKLSKFVNRAAGVALIGRMSTIMVQSMQLGAGVAKMPVGAYTIRLAKLFAGRLNWVEALNTPYVQRRIKQMPPIAQMAMEGFRALKPNRLKYAAAQAGKSIPAADGFFTAGTYAIVHDYQMAQARKLGLTGPAAAEHARRETERAVDEIAQPTRAGTRSLYENRNQANPIYRLAWAFGSEPRKNIALLAYAAANKTVAEQARALLYVVVFNALLATVLRTAYRDARDGDDDEIFDERNWDPKRMALRAAVDPLHGMPIIGDLVEGLIYAALGEYMPEGNLLSSAPRAASAARKLPDLFTGEGNIEESLIALEAILSGLGLANETIAAAASFSHLARDLFGMAKNAAGEE